MPWNKKNNMGQSMPLDHYVSQVHLRQFYSKTEKQLHGAHKQDLKKFHCYSKDVCRINNGSTNEYLIEPRAIEDFLPKIEKNYKDAIDKIQKGEINPDIIYVIAGWIAYVNACSPAGMRIHSEHPKAIAREVVRSLELIGKIPPLSENFSLMTCLDLGYASIKVNPKYPQSIGIKNIENFTYMLGNYRWEALINNFTDSPFFTSDYPITIENTHNSIFSNLIIPLSPNLALRIHTSQEKSFDPQFKENRFYRKEISHNEVCKINQLIVQCAEDIVFFGDEYPWVMPFIVKNSKYRIAVVTNTQRLPGQSFVAAKKIIMSNQHLNK